VGNWSDGVLLRQGVPPLLSVHNSALSRTNSFESRLYEHLIALQIFHERARCRCIPLEGWYTTAQFPSTPPNVAAQAVSWYSVASPGVARLLAKHPLPTLMQLPQIPRGCISQMTKHGSVLMCRPRSHDHALGSGMHAWRLLKGR
jgi:hypothetical protein